MPVYKGMSGRVVLGNEQSKINPHNTKVVSRYNNNSVCQLPSLINSKACKNCPLFLAIIKGSAVRTNTASSAHGSALILLYHT